MYYIFSRRTRAHDMLITPLPDGANLPDVAERRLRFVIPLPSKPNERQSDVRRILRDISVDGFARIGAAPYLPCRARRA